MEAKIYREIIEALQPLVDIADAYDRQEFSDSDYVNVWLYHSNKMVLLSECMVAREVSNRLKALVGN